MKNLNNTSPNQIYIGYEAREHDAFRVCEYTINKLNISYPFRQAIPLKSEDIPEYTRDWGEPQSTDFTFTRFWVHYLSDFKGISIYCDCDFMFLDNPAKLFHYVEDNNKALAVIKHPIYTPNSATKMHGIPQHKSYRKNWASLMVFNNEHPSNKILQPDYLNTHRPGMDFHHLTWLKDEEIESIPIEWNVLDGYYHLENPKAIHYTDGGPWEFGSIRQEWSRYSDLWTDKLQEIEAEAVLLEKN